MYQKLIKSDRSCRMTNCTTL